MKPLLCLVLQLVSSLTTAASIVLLAVAVVIASSGVAEAGPVRSCGPVTFNPLTGAYGCAAPSDCWWWQTCTLRFWPDPQGGFTITCDCL